MYIFKWQSVFCGYPETVGQKHIVHLIGMEKVR